MSDGAGVGTGERRDLVVLPVLGIKDVRPGDDLAALLVEAAPWLADGDVLVVTSKIVSKAEGRLLEVPADGPERDSARQAAIAAETVRVVARRGPTEIVVTRHGFVMAAAGIDASNVDSRHLVLLPEDPDASARALRAALRDRYRLDVAVIISDTAGRPWRMGLTDMALGAAGIHPVHDYRGEVDAYGNHLQLTEMAVIDELAGAAELVKGKYDQVPAAVVRGLAVTGTPDGPGAAALVRPVEADLFSLGTAEAAAQGRREAATLAQAERFADVPVDPAAIRRALLALAGASDPAGGLWQLPAGLRDKVVAEVPGLEACCEIFAISAPENPMACARTGATVHRLRSALAADGLVSLWTERVPEPLAGLLTPPAGEVGLGLLAIGYPAV